MIRKTRIIGTIFAIFYFCVFLSFMTKAEQPQMRRKIPFPKMDINGDGKISRKEFPGPKIAFDRLDKDRNGFLTLEELRQADAVKQSNIDDKKSSQSNRITIDVHDHLVGRNSNDFKQSIREALSQMNQLGVKKMFIMPPPFYQRHAYFYQYSEFLDVIRKYSDRFAFLGGGGILNVMIQQALKNGKVDATMKRTFTRKAEKIIKDGAIGFGEMTTEHLCLGPRHNHQEAPPDHPLFLLLADIAASHDIPIDIHMEAVPKKMKVPEHLSGFSAIGTSIVFGCLFSQFLNNLSYRILLFLFGSIFLDKISGGLESFFFFLALFICPEAFLVGIIGSIVLFTKRRKNVQK